MNLEAGLYVFEGIMEGLKSNLCNKLSAVSNLAA